MPWNFSYIHSRENQTGSRIKKQAFQATLQPTCGKDCQRVFSKQPRVLKKLALQA